MKRSLLVVSLVTVLALLAACSSDRHSGAHSTTGRQSGGHHRSTEPCNRCTGCTSNHCTGCRHKGRGHYGPSGGYDRSRSKSHHRRSPSAQPLAGKTVRIFGVAADEQARLFQQEFNAFTQRTGVKVRVRGQQGLRDPPSWSASKGGNAPDIAQFAQPGLVRTSSARIESSTSTVGWTRPCCRSSSNRASWTWRRSTTS